MSLSRESQLIKEYVEKMLDYLRKESVQELKRTDHPAFFEKMNNKFSHLKEKLPSLFNMLIEGNPDEFEMRRLEDMLYMKDRVNNNQISAERASVQIGQQYFNEYVKPHVDMSKEPDHPHKRL